MSTIYMHRIDLQSCAHIWLLYIAKICVTVVGGLNGGEVQKVCQERNKKPCAPMDSQLPSSSA